MYFNSDMDYGEAQYLLFKLSEGMTDEEKKDMLNEYKTVVSQIIKKELNGDPALTEYKYMENK